MAPNARPSTCGPALERHSDQARRALGRLGEHLAADHLRRRGCIELARNARTRHGEIDLIVLDGRVLVFVEVKTRRIATHQREIREDQHPLRGLGGPQRRRIRSSAAAWLRERPRGHRPADTIRFDAIGVVVDTGGARRSVEHVESAF
jgi:putative endonuclease